MEEEHCWPSQGIGSSSAAALLSTPERILHWSPALQDKGAGALNLCLFAHFLEVGPGSFESFPHLSLETLQNLSHWFLFPKRAQPWDHLRRFQASKSG